MGNSSSSDKLTDAETTALEHFNNKDFASLMKLLEQEPVDLFKLVSINKDNPEDIKNGYDFIHTLLSYSRPSSSAVSILKAFKQTIESNKKKNSDEKLFRETLQFDEFPYSYLQFVIFNNPQDLDSFIFLLDNKEAFPSPPPASQSLVHDLCSNPRAIELLRHLISSGEFPERFKNSSSTNNLDEQMRGSANSVIMESHRSFTPLQVACAAVNKLAVQELCVAGLGGSNYGECAETLLTTAIAGEHYHNLGSMVLFKKENAGAVAQPQAVSVDDVVDILLCLLAQPNAANSIRKRRARLSSIRSQKARDGIIAVFLSKFNHFCPETVNLMHLAFAFYCGINQNNSNSSSADTFLKTVLNNKIVVCTPEELTPISKNDKLLFGESIIACEQYRFQEWLIASEHKLDLSHHFSNHERVDDNTLQRVSSVFPALQSLNLTSCNKITDNGLAHVGNLLSLQSLTLERCTEITDNGLRHLVQLSSLQTLNLDRCFNITDFGLEHLAKLSSLQSLNLTFCNKITDTGLERHLAELLLLQMLNLRCCDKITDNGVRHLTELKLLESLDITFCPKISDSAVEFLRTKLPSTHLER